jgi:predicted alpha/beta-fold hydrolase
VWDVPTSDLVVESSDGARLLVRASFQEGDPARSPGLVLLHGLGGSDASGYLLATGLLAHAAGYHVFRMNMRGAGDSFSLCPHLYNAGLDVDLVAVLRTLGEQARCLAVAGFSLGASLVLLALGRRRQDLPAALRAGVGVSPPLDLKACVRAFEAGPNQLYGRHFVSELKERYKKKQEALPTVYEAGLERGVRTVYDFDERITARYGGYRGADDYYARTSAGPWLAAVETPTLLLAAEDDPLIPMASLLPFSPSRSVVREWTRTGGHMGFIGPARARGHFWAAERLLDFVDQHVGEGAA